MACTETDVSALDMGVGGLTTNITELDSKLTERLRVGDLERKLDKKFAGLDNKMAGRWIQISQNFSCYLSKIINKTSYKQKLTRGISNSEETVELPLLYRAPNTSIYYMVGTRC